MTAPYLETQGRVSRWPLQRLSGAAARSLRFVFSGGLRVTGRCRDSGCRLAAHERIRRAPSGLLVWAVELVGPMPRASVAQLAGSSRARCREWSAPRLGPLRRIDGVRPTVRDERARARRRRTLRPRKLRSGPSGRGRSPAASQSVSRRHPMRRCPAVAQRSRADSVSSRRLVGERIRWGGPAHGPRRPSGDGPWASHRQCARRIGASGSVRSREQSAGMCGCGTQMLARACSCLHLGLRGRRQAA